MRRFKNLAVGLKAHRCTGVIGRTYGGQLSGLGAVLETHEFNAFAVVHIHFQPLRQGVDYAGAHAVQAAGDLIALAAELTAGVQDGIHDLERGGTRLMVLCCRDAASVVAHFNHVVGLNFHLDVGTIARQRFVYGVIDNFIDQMVQSGLRRRADIHTGALAHGFQPFQHLNL